MSNYFCKRSSSSTFLPTFHLLHVLLHWSTSCVTPSSADVSTVIRLCQQLPLCKAKYLAPCLLFSSAKKLFHWCLTPVVQLEQQPRSVRVCVCVCKMRLDCCYTSDERHKTKSSMGAPCGRRRYCILKHNRGHLETVPFFRYFI